MKITSAEFVKSAVDHSQCPRDGLPEIALIGRSNVGKSSLINAFVNRKGLAKTSSRPGKTCTINFYRINNRFYLVDLPGFGYSSV
ncbi:MAG: ribosome biogenesis GTP-binding protein YsxC, partial [Deltaproteobacteria bacterium]|nr:ribosome biogenesis GTP-binding protein YsxC [Deltaproteobacteria bacterium]